MPRKRPHSTALKRTSKYVLSVFLLIKDRKFLTLKMQVWK